MNAIPTAPRTGAHCSPLGAGPYFAGVVLADIPQIICVLKHLRKNGGDAVKRHGHDSGIICRCVEKDALALAAQQLPAILRSQTSNGYHSERTHSREERG